LIISVLNSDVLEKYFIDNQIDTIFTQSIVDKNSQNTKKREE